METTYGSFCRMVELPGEVNSEDIEATYKKGVLKTVHHSDKREKDRRKELCEGYCYISTVGWICRRERFRRKGAARTH